jgi:hypothetical protein
VNKGWLREICCEKLSFLMRFSIIRKLILCWLFAYSLALEHTNQELHTLDSLIIESHETTTETKEREWKDQLNHIDPALVHYNLNKNRSIQSCLTSYISTNLEKKNLRLEGV